MKRLTIFLGTLFLAFTANSQTQHSAYTAVGKGVATTFLTDYQTLGVNASSLGWGTGYKGKRTTIGTSEFAFGMTSPTLDKEKLGNAATGLWNTVRDKENSEFDFDKQREAAADYAEAGIGINADYNWFGASYQDENFGGAAVAIRESYSFYGELSEKASDLVFRGRTSGYFDSLTIAIDGDTSRIANSPNLSNDTLMSVIEGTSSNPELLSDITDGSKISFTWNREYNFGYGRRLFGDDSTFAMYGGVSGRFIQSVAMFDFESNDGDFRARSSLSPFFDVDYGSAAMGNPGALLENDGLLPAMTGNGYGIDVALSTIIGGKIKIAAAVNNFGSITYTQNAYTVEDQLVSSVRMPGLDDYDFTESMTQLIEEGSIMTLIGEEEIVVQNPATFRMGGSIELGKLLDVGVDIVAPFNSDNPGSLQNAVISVGGDFKPLDWLHLSAGYFGGGVYQHNIPVGINFVLGDGAYEVGIASRDALSFFVKDGNSISTALGFARVRF